jgi:PiT family inorganic phosphate transporter
MGSRIHKMDAAQGFAAQGAGSAVILAASHVGFPLSTTHTISGAVIGSGAAKRLSAVRWGVAGNIVVAWILTLPMAALIGGLTYLLTRVFGTGAVGPIVVSTLIVAGAAFLYSRRSQQAGVPPAVEGS